MNSDVTKIVVPYVTRKVVSYELRREKTVFGVSKQVWQKSACTDTEAGWRIEILAISTREIVLSSSTWPVQSHKKARILKFWV